MLDRQKAVAEAQNRLSQALNKFKKLQVRSSKEGNTKIQRKFFIKNKNS